MSKLFSVVRLDLSMKKAINLFISMGVCLCMCACLAIIICNAFKICSAKGRIFIEVYFTEILQMLCGV